MNQYQSPMTTEEAGRRLRAYPALVAACQAALQVSHDPIVERILIDALAAAGDRLDVDPEYEASIADVGLHGENAEPQAMSDPLPVLDGTIREEA